MGLAGLFHRNKQGVVTPLEIDGLDGDDPPLPDAGGWSPPLPAPAPKSEAPPETLAQLQQQLAETNRRLKASEDAREQDRKDRAAGARAEQVSAIHAGAAAFAEGQRGKVVSACEGPLAALHAHAALSAAGLPTNRADGTPIDAAAELANFCKALPPHNLGGERVASAAARGLKALDNGSGEVDENAKIRAANDARYGPPKAR